MSCPTSGGSQVVSLKFTYPAVDGTDSSITSSPEFAIFQQLESDSNAELNARNFLFLDSTEWTALNNEIGQLVLQASEATNANQASLIYGQIMMIITAQYLPTVSNYLGDQIAEQSATENIASDVSSFILDAENGFNGLATVENANNQDMLFDGVMSLTGTNIAGASNTAIYNYSFNVDFVAVSPSGAITTGSRSENGVLDFLSDTCIWGSTTPLSSSGTSQISNALANIPALFNAEQTGVVYGTTGPNNTSSFPSSNPWYIRDLNVIAQLTYTWTQVYGASTVAAYPGGLADNYGSGNAPLVFTQPNSIQADFNQASQAVETVSTTQQTIQNFTVQEIDQFYGITNSIQQSQEAQCAAIVKHFSS